MGTIPLICPSGDGTFDYSEFSLSGGITVPEQAYDGCTTNPCSDAQWTEIPYSVNHCSDPTGTAPDYFLPACDMHDMCYRIPGIKQINCDDWFYHNMNKTCYIKICGSGASSSSNECGYCNNIANAGYQFVKYAGHDDYFDAQVQGLNFWCNGESDKVQVKDYIISTSDVKSGYIVFLCCFIWFLFFCNQYWHHL